MEQMEIYSDNIELFLCYTVATNKKLNLKYSPTILL